MVISFTLCQNHNPRPRSVNYETKENVMMFSNRNSFHKITYFEIVIGKLNGEFLEIILAFDLCAV